MRRFVGQAGSLGGKGKDPRICSKKKKKRVDGPHLSGGSNGFVIESSSLLTGPLPSFLLWLGGRGPAILHAKTLTSQALASLSFFRAAGGGGQAGQDGENGKKRMIFDHM